MHDHNTNAQLSSSYARLGLMAALSFVAMYVLMYAMVDSIANVIPNLNQAFMAALMAAPMVLIELALMGMMYRRRTWNAAIAGLSTVVLVVSFLFIRNQTAIGDGQFLDSMIPHHSAAILMCQQASLEDAQIRDLCDRIVANQQAEIDEMKAIKARLAR